MPWLSSRYGLHHFGRTTSNRSPTDILPQPQFDRSGARHQPRTPWATPHQANSKLSFPTRNRSQPIQTSMASHTARLRWKRRNPTGGVKATSAQNSHKRSVARRPATRALRANPRSCSSESFVSSIREVCSHSLRSHPCEQYTHDLCFIRPHDDAIESCHSGLGIRSRQFEVG
jgi:hypothetical protein